MIKRLLKKKKYTEYFLEIYIVKEITNNFVLKFKPFTINLIFRIIVLDHNKYFLTHKNTRIPKELLYFKDGLRTILLLLY